MDDHPAMMPMKLARRCVAFTSRPGDVVLDPYAGSGTTLIAAQDLGRRWVGVELNPAYVNLIERRMGAGTPPLCGGRSSRHMSPDQHHKDLEALKARIDDLSPMATRFVARLIESLASPPQATLNPRRTWITESADWVEYFSLALSVHHGTTTEPLGLTGFEVVFCGACEAVEWDYEKPASATHRFVDLVVRRDTEPERKLS